MSWLEERRGALPEKMLEIVERLEQIPFSEVNRRYYCELADEIYFWMEEACKIIGVLGDDVDETMKHEYELDQSHKLSKVMNFVKFYHERLSVLENTLSTAEKSLMLASWQSKYDQDSPKRFLWNFFEYAVLDEDVPVSIKLLWEIYILMQMIPYSPEDTLYIEENLTKIHQSTVSEATFMYCSKISAEQYGSIRLLFSEEAVDIAYDVLEWYDERYDSSYKDVK